MYTFKTATRKRNLILALLCLTFISVIYFVSYTKSLDNSVPKIKLASSNTNDIQPMIKTHWNNSFIKKRGCNVAATGIRPKSRYITTVLLQKSGLGNVMFQLASLYGIAQGLTLTPIIFLNKSSIHHATENNLLQNQFINVKKRVNVLTVINGSKITTDGNHFDNVDSHWAQALEFKSNSFDRYLIDNVDPCVNITLVGFFQSYRYFEEFGLEVAEMFEVPAVASAKAQQFLSAARSIVLRNIEQEGEMQLGEGIVYIGVHVRRGDFLSDNMRFYGYTVADEKYFERAFDYYRKLFMLNHLVYVVTSDDIPWCKKNFRQFDGGDNTFVYSEFNDQISDLALLTQCNHSVVTVGTFSWWSGWLTGGHVTYYKDFPRANSKLQRAFSLDKSDYFPAHWEGL